MCSHCGHLYSHPYLNRCSCCGLYDYLFWSCGSCALRCLNDLLFFPEHIKELYIYCGYLSKSAMTASQNSIVTQSCVLCTVTRFILHSLFQSSSLELFSSMRSIKLFYYKFLLLVCFLALFLGYICRISLFIRERKHLQKYQASLSWCVSATSSKKFNYPIKSHKTE